MGKKVAFSIIELLVVLAIVGVLAAIAVPAYKNYAIRAKVAKGLNILQDFAHATQVAYVRGSLNTGSTTFSYNGVSIPANGTMWNAASTFPGILTALTLWGPGNGVVGGSNREWVISVRIAGLNDIPGYVLNDARSEILYRVVENNGVFSAYCGRWDSSSIYNIPLEYLPAACNCSSVSTKSC